MAARRWSAGPALGAASSQPPPKAGDLPARVGIEVLKRFVEPAERCLRGHLHDSEEPSPPLAGRLSAPAPSTCVARPGNTADPCVARSQRWGRRFHRQTCGPSRRSSRVRPSQDGLGGEQGHGVLCAVSSLRAASRAAPGSCRAPRCRGNQGIEGSGLSCQAASTSTSSASSAAGSSGFRAWTGSPAAEVLTRLRASTFEASFPSCAVSACRSSVRCLSVPVVVAARASLAVCSSSGRQRAGPSPCAVSSSCRVSSMSVRVLR